MEIIEHIIVAAVVIYFVLYAVVKMYFNIKGQEIVIPKKDERTPFKIESRDEKSMTTRASRVL